MKSQLITIVAALLLVGCGPSVDIWTGAQTGNIEAVKQHLADGVDVNSKSDIGRTPLDVAIAFKQPLITDLLRKHGGKTRDELKAAESIVVAVELGNIEAVKQHLNDGNEVNAKGGTGRTPLHWAAIEGHKEIAELLIAEGADVNAKSEGGTTPLDMANDRETADLLRKHGGKYGTIYGAAGGGDIEAVKEFLAIGADVNAKAGNGKTPLHDAATKEITELLIANGADVNAKDDDGWIPLLYAAEGGYNEIVELLIDKGADVNVKDKRRFTPLHWVSISGHKEAAELLIDNGADVNAMRGGGGTPLSYAASWGHEEIVELLIANGADVNVKDAFSETPLDVATHPDNPNASAETADLLRKHGGKTREELKAKAK